MATGKLLDVRLFTALVEAQLPAAEQDRVVDLCQWVLTAVPQLDLPHRGRTTRSAVLLLLAESVPHLPEAVRNQLAHVCELIAVLKPHQ